MNKPCKRCGGVGIIVIRPSCEQIVCPACNGTGAQTAYARGTGARREGADDHAPSQEAEQDAKAGGQ